jgi:LacI family transcriptional regulator
VLAASREGLADPHLGAYQSPPDLWRARASLAAPILQDRTRPDAVICFDDKLALALLDALRDANLRVPEEVAVVGFDDIPFAALSNPRLTTVAQPSADMGRLAASMLLDWLERGQPPASVTLPVEVVIRESSLHHATIRSRVA